MHSCTTLHALCIPLKIWHSSQNPWGHSSQKYHPPVLAKHCHGKCTYITTLQFKPNYTKGVRFMGTHNMRPHLWQIQPRATCTLQTLQIMQHNTCTLQQTLQINTITYIWQIMSSATSTQNTRISQPSRHNTNTLWQTLPHDIHLLGTHCYMQHAYKQ